MSRSREGGARLERLPTGIPGLDRLIEGGLLKGGAYVIQGPSGAGKTVLASQVAFSVAAAGQRAVYATLLAESHARLLKHLQRMRFYDPGAVPDRMYFVSLFKVLETEGLDGLQAALRKLVASPAAALLVVDTMVAAEELAPSPLAYRKFMQQLQTIAAMSDCVVLLLIGREASRPTQAELSMVDGVIELTDEMAKLRSVRHLNVRKMRGTDPVRGRHSLEISDEGVAVHARLETSLSSGSRPRVTPGDRRLTVGVAALDEMLGGGLVENSTTMLLGPSGCGKTILGLQFLTAGAAAGEPGVYFGFYERPEALALKSARIGLGVAEAARAGKLALVWQPAVEGSIDLLGERLFEAVARMEARRLVLDGVQGFQIAIDSQDRIRDVFSALVVRLEREGITTLYTMETDDLFGPSIQSPVTGASAVTHNIILMRHVELRAELRRLISILKLRDSAYDSRIREFRITDQGLVVADTFASAEQILSGTACPPPRAKGGGAPRTGKRSRAEAKAERQEGKAERRRGGSREARGR